MIIRVPIGAGTPTATSGQSLVTSGHTPLRTANEARSDHNGARCTPSPRVSSPRIHTIHTQTDQTQPLASRLPLAARRSTMARRPGPSLAPSALPLFCLAIPSYSFGSSNLETRSSILPERVDPSASPVTGGCTSRPEHTSTTRASCLTSQVLVLVLAGYWCHKGPPSEVDSQSPPPSPAPINQSSLPLWRPVNR